MEGQARRGAEKGRGRRSEGGRWEEGLLLGAGGSGGSALPRSVHLGESWNVGRISGPSAATAMRGARGAWDFLCVLLLLFGLQTGGRARRHGPRPPSFACAPVGSNSEGCFGGGGCRPPVPVRFSLRKDWRRPWNSPAPSLAHLREEPQPLGVGVLGWGPPGVRAAGALGVSQVQPEGAGCVPVWGCFCAEGARGQRRAGRGFAPSALSPPCEARPLLPFVKS